VSENAKSTVPSVKPLRPEPDPPPGYERLWLDHFDQAGIHASNKFFTADDPLPVRFVAFAGATKPSDSAITLTATADLTNRPRLFFIDINTSP
jgi:hypothetical protein